MQEILQHLKRNGEQLDAEIAAATGLSLSKVRMSLTALSAQGEVVVCRSIRYQHGKPVDGLLCRMAGYTPPAAPGRKAKPRI